MLRISCHSHLAASFAFRIVCRYRHPPPASRTCGAFRASDLGLWPTSNIVRCNSRLRWAGSMASAASEKVSSPAGEGDSSSAADVSHEGLGLETGRGGGAEEKEAGKSPKDVTEHDEKEDGDDEDEDEEEEEEEDDEEEEEEDRRRVGDWFQLWDSSSLVLSRGDITKWYVDGKTDVIVNAANEMMLGGGGVDGAIHKAAGKKLLDACYELPEVSRGVRCAVGNAVITPGFNLPASRIIHTVGPIYYKEDNPAEMLGKAYKNSIALAVKEKVKYIAFPAISCGVYGYPYEEAAKVSIQALQESAGEMTEVHFVFFEAGTYNAWLSEAEETLKRMRV